MRVLPVLLAASFSVSSAANAVPIALDFSGTFTELTDLTGGFAELLGQPYSGRIVYESDTNGTPSATLFGVYMTYHGAIVESAVSVGSVVGTLDGVDSSLIQVIPSGVLISGIGGMTFSFPLSMPSLLSDEAIDGRLVFIQGSQQPITSNALPLEFALADMPGVDPRSGRATWSFFGLSSIDQFFAEGRLTAANASVSVPEPGAVGLLAIGLAGLFVARRRVGVGKFARLEFR